MLLLTHQTLLLIYAIACFSLHFSYVNSNYLFDKNFDLKLCSHESAERKIFKKNQAEKTEGRADEEVTYTGAVLEYRPYDKWTDEAKGYGVVKRNAEAFVSYAMEAKLMGADILVTPEYGLQSLDMFYNDTSKFLTYTQNVPNPADKIIPCSVQDGYENIDALRILSCGAANYSIYLVIDMAELSVCSPDVGLTAPFPIELSEDCPDVGYFVFNTQVVFDREGMVVARYRKQNLYLESYFSPGPEDDITAIFVTDFNVAFTLEICFDIVYDHPAYSNVKQYGIKDVVMSSAWVDELPFDVADGIQNGWSRGLGANLLVAGHHIPEINMLGSGIFKGLTNEEPNYVYNRNSGDVLLISTVRTISASSLPDYQIWENQSKYSSKMEPFIQRNLKVSNDQRTKPLSSFSKDEGRLMKPLLHTNLSNYSRVILKAGEPDEVRVASACDSDNFCCNLQYTYSGNLTYMLVVNSGQNLLGDDSYVEGLQICGVVWCLTKNYETCAVVELGHFDIDLFGPFLLSSSTFSAEVVYPIGLRRNLSLISNADLHFNHSEYLYSISSSPSIEQPLTLALYGRWFGNDM